MRMRAVPSQLEAAVEGARDREQQTMETHWSVSRTALPISMPGAVIVMLMYGFPSLQAGKTTDGMASFLVEQLKEIPTLHTKFKKIAETKGAEVSRSSLMHALPRPVHVLM
jgi:hypothetical protein